MTTAQTSTENEKPFADPSKSHKERILSFIEGKKGTVRLNDFLKSLYPLLNPPEWSKQSAMKKLRIDLADLAASSNIKFVNDLYNRLGKHYFPDQNTGKTHYYNLSDTIIEVEIL